MTHGSHPVPGPRDRSQVPPVQLSRSFGSHPIDSPVVELETRFGLSPLSSKTLGDRLEVTLTGADRPLLGRDHDLATVEAFISGIQDGFSLLSLEGEAGIGKTALWEKAIEHAGARGISLLTSRPSEAESSLSFVGLNDLLSSVPERIWSELPAPSRAALEAALQRAPAGSTAEPGAVAIAFLALVDQLANQGPLLIGVDDYQWLDRPTSRVLEFALRRLTDHPLRALVSSRSPASTTWERALGQARIIKLTLGPLSPSALYNLIYERLGVPLGRPTLLRVHETSRGNPFFALELARELLEHREDEYRGGPLPLPGELIELLHRRLKRLSPRMLRLLLAIAAMSSPQIDDLRKLLPKEGSLAPDLDKAEHAGIIHVGQGTVRFTHPMLAAAAYAAATRSERDRVHARLSALVTDPEEASRHLALATHDPDEGAATTMAEAAASAQARGATDIAAHFAEQALRVTPPQNREEVFSRALAAGDLALAAGNQARARELFDQAVALSTQGRERALGLLRKADLASPLRYATDLCEQALLEADEPSLLSRIHRTLGSICYAMGDVGAAEQNAKQAVELAEQGGDHQALGLAIAELAHWTFCGGGGYREDLFKKAVSLESSCAASSPRSHYAKITMDAGHLERSRVQLDQLLEEATGKGDLQAVAAHRLHLAQLETWLGNFRLAIQHADESLLLHEYSDQPGAPRYVKAMSLACLGQVDLAREEAKAGLAEAERSENVLLTIYNLHVLGFVELSLDNPAAARPHLDRAIELHRPRWNREFGDAHFVPDQIEALIALGDLGRAEDLVAWMEEVGTSTARPWALATGARSRAILLAAQGGSEEADQKLRDALSYHRQVSMPFELARTLLFQGTIQRRHKQRASAAETLRRARAIFTDLGSPLWAAKAATELGRVGVRSRAQSALTPIELHVASLATQGHNNREIADLLFISRKTVEANLTHIYRKLGIRSRAQLGTALPRGGSQTPSK